MSLTDKLVEEIRARATTVGTREAAREAAEALAAAQRRCGIEFPMLLESSAALTREPVARFRGR